MSSETGRHPVLQRARYRLVGGRNLSRGWAILHDPYEVLLLRQGQRGCRCKGSRAGRRNAVTTGLVAGEFVALASAGRPERAPNMQLLGVPG